MKIVKKLSEIVKIVHKCQKCKKNQKIKIVKVVKIAKNCLSGQKLSKLTFNDMSYVPKSKSGSVSQSVTMPPIELSTDSVWTAKNGQK